MKKFMFIVILALSVGVTNAQVFILGDATVPSIGAMVHFQTMDCPQMGFYNYGTYGKSLKTGNEFHSLTLAAGLTYYISKRRDPQDCLRFYGGFNYNVWFWNDELLFPGKTISFDLGVSKTLGRFTLMVMADPLNVALKPGFSIYF